MTKARLLKHDFPLHGFRNRRKVSKIFSTRFGIFRAGLRTRSTTTRDRNLQFRGAVSAGGSLHWIFCFFSSIYVQFSKTSPLKSGESSEKSSGENRVESCHVCGCHGYFGPEGQKTSKSSNKSVKHSFRHFRAAPVFWPFLGGGALRMQMRILTHPEKFASDFCDQIFLRIFLDTSKKACECSGQGSRNNIAN